MAGDEVVHVKAHWPRPAVAIMAFEVEGTFVREEPAHRIDDEAIRGARFRRKGVDNDAVARATFIVAQPGAAFDPLLCQGLRRQRPTEEPLDSTILIDDE